MTLSVSPFLFLSLASAYAYLDCSEVRSQVQCLIQLLALAVSDFSLSISYLEHIQFVATCLTFILETGQEQINKHKHKSTFCATDTLF